MVQAWAPNYTVLLLARLAFGIAIVARQPARALLTAQWFPRREIVLVNGLVNTTYGASAVIALLLTPYLQIWLDESWRWTLTIYGTDIHRRYLGLGRRWQGAKNGGTDNSPRVAGARDLR